MRAVIPFIAAARLIKYGQFTLFIIENEDSDC
jgi:hypothetical protein